MTGQIIFGRTYDYWVEEMARLGSFEGNSTLKAVANAFERPIHMISAHEGTARYTCIVPDALLAEEDVTADKDTGV